MPTIYDLKPKFQQLLQPIVDKLAVAGYTPNQITLSALIISIIYGGLLAYAPSNIALLLLLPIVLLIRMALNAIDGLLARQQKMETKLGLLINELSDIISDTTLYLPFALIVNAYAPLVIIIVILSIVAETTGILAIVTSHHRAYNGPMGKSDRAFTFGLLAILLAFNTPTYLINSLLAITMVLLLLTIINRCKAALSSD
ncbi:CDP-alcohol phosphatidyltransferase family protein [Zooshikella ganghwensis]|uniref:CDP-alcohol phosphatidyltransferase family protein n=1 Tax=Zooshikella ganghwensis TaxID=202772 RepID=A0A4P9VUH3_9GAMM|nr:CDP-alcohol phosphatidyltransferase family protein [Zooshikella ganghwensis]RDH46084.1 CDP-alcohol phosphatidyltransferase family protein [Zooshikella ganghwensis]